jgi:hypothetical protein
VSTTRAPQAPLRSRHGPPVGTQGTDPAVADRDAVERDPVPTAPAGVDGAAQCPTRWVTPVCVCGPHPSNPRSSYAEDAAAPPHRGYPHGPGYSASTGSSRAAFVRRELAVRWQLPDSQALPFADGEFDIVLSCIGAVFPPERGAAARALGRSTAEYRSG